MPSQRSAPTDSPFRELLAACQSEFTIIAASGPPALQGDPSAIKSYTEAFRSLAQRAAGILDPPPQDRRLLLLAAHTLGAAALVSPCARQFGPALGVTLYIIHALAPPAVYAESLQAALAEAPGSGHPGSPSPVAFRTLFRAASQPTPPAEPLHLIRDLFQLSSLELAPLFSVSDQTIRNWLSSEAAPSQRTQVRLVHKSAALLARNLAPECIPDFVRLELPALGGHTVLGALRLGRHAEVLATLRTLFDWGSLE